MHPILLYFLEKNQGGTLGTFFFKSSLIMCVSVLLSRRVGYHAGTYWRPQKSHVPSVSFGTILGGGGAGEIFTQRYS